MQQRARTRGGFRHWTGRVLPVLAVALLAIGPAHGKDKKKKKDRDAAVPMQVERPAEGERPAQEDPPSLISKPSKGAPPVQNMREPSRAEPLAVSIDRVIEQVERRYKAKVINTKQTRKGDRLVYELKLLSDDGVRTIKVDAETGKEL